MYKIGTLLGCFLFSIAGMAQGVELPEVNLKMDVKILSGCNDNDVCITIPGAQVGNLTGLVNGSSHKVWILPQPTEVTLLGVDKNFFCTASSGGANGVLKVFANQDPPKAHKAGGGIFSISGKAAKLICTGTDDFGDEFNILVK